MNTTDDCNSGNCNSGDYNSGHFNTSYCNSGNYNSGSRNSGDGNSSNCNSGDYNSGNYNSGDNNSGNYNSGDCNSGNCNSGNCNSGDYNSGDYNSGYFNTTEPTVRMFNRETGLSRDEISLPYIQLALSEWICVENMTKQQKEDNPNYRTSEGFLLTRSYKEAWAAAWEDLSTEKRRQFMCLPNFDAEIFKEITGIDTGVESLTCANQMVEIDGKRYRLTPV